MITGIAADPEQGHRTTYNNGLPVSPPITTLAGALPCHTTGRTPTPHRNTKRKHTRNTPRNIGGKRVLLILKRAEERPKVPGLAGPDGHETIQSIRTLILRQASQNSG